ncbi:MAG: hypothetical protein J1E00_06680 [Oscillospiraceae bacterium]|nr:hypothetical protein [Oscillospiraceae bacterium]
MWSVDTAYGLLAVFLSSTGVLGLGLSAVLAYLLRRAKQDAEQKHAERIKLELQRLEGEELLSAIVLLLAKKAGEDEKLGQAMQAYGEYLKRTRRSRDEMLSQYTVK